MEDEPHGVHDFVYDPRNADVLVSVNGELKHRDEATVSVFDSGYLLGDGVWEGLRVKDGGVAFLDFLMKEFDRDPILVLAGYNAGEGAVKSHKGVPPYSETRDYVPKVLAAFKTAKGLCRTPPQLVSDGCVFNVDVSGG